ncbi:MAG TPA: 2-oxoglutarate dehydrogenase, E2 component, dihydrolipoamide succinyltransferase [Nocardioides sp.]|jgi:pyruvate dehydrogenase E2 component (dihydrolipoamide acetyltransferase)|nr:2-oxoglutarate dehydrogenase, E2 component, dihydrolipoamide succinyltransferase [Nocardioides sp.]
MATEVNLPELGESVTEGTVTRWLKQIGDEVAVDEPLLEVSTDKVDTEIPSPVSGTLLEIKANEDDTVEVGAVLGVIGAADESSGGAGAGADGGAGQAEPEPESTPEPEPAQEQSREEAAETPLDEEAVEREEAHAEAERADTHSEPERAQEERAQEEPAQEQQHAEAPREEVAAATSGAAESSGGGRTVVRLPELGESVTEGTVTRWLKQVGDEVAADESLLEVSTDKVDTEIPSPASGTLLEIKVDEDETVDVGAELAVIGSGEAPAAAEQDAASAPEESTPEQPAEQPAEQPSEKTAEEPAPEQPEQPAAEEAPAEQPAAEVAPSGGRDSSAYVTPLVRKMAAQHGVDLASIAGTGVGGRIRKQDVLDAAQRQGTDTSPTQPAAAAAAAAQPAPTPSAPAAAAPGAPVPSPLRGKTEPMTRLRKVIAQRMVESLHVSAQLTTVVEVDVTAISRLRDSVKADFASREGVKLSFMPFFAKAAIDALKAHPSLNAAIDTEKGEVTYFDRENLAIAVDTERGLLTPVIKEAGDLSIAGLARKIADVAERTRTNKITPDELSGGTFTLTNTGSRGALFDTPIINQPQVAILGTGAVVKRPVVIDDPNLGETIAVRQMVYLALTYDHRLVDGADAARFLTEMKARLEGGQFEV